MTEMTTTTRTKTIAPIAVIVGGVAILGLAAGIFLLGNNPFTRKVSIKPIPSATETFVVDTPLVTQTPVDNGGVTYQKLSFADIPFGTSDDIGKPDLPFLTKSVALPDQATNIKVAATVTGQVAGISDIIVYPVPKQEVKKNEQDLSYVDEVFTKNDESYQKNSFLPDQYVTITKDSSFRSQRMVSLTINPLQYNPVQKTLKQATQLTVTVTYDLNNAVKSGKNKLSGFTQLTQKMVVNPTDVAMAGTTVQTASVTHLTAAQLHTPPTNIDYIIITNSIYTGTELNDFANYRATTDNFHVGIAYVSDIYSQFPAGGVDNDATIKAFITNAYTNWPQPAPMYVLLLGRPRNDSYGPQVPAHYYVEYENLDDRGYSDSWFGDINDDKTIDLAVGRFYTDTKAELQVISNKIKCYEQESICPGSWRDEAWTINSTSFYHAGLAGDILKSTMGLAGAVTCPQYQFIQNMPLIRGNVLYHNAHGTYYYTECFSADAMGYLTNLNQTPVILSVSCSNANYYYPRNIAREFMKVPNKGAVAYFGSTTLESLLTSPVIKTAVLSQFFDDQIYPLGQNIMLVLSTVEGRSAAKSTVLLGDPALHFLGYKSDPAQPDLAISSTDVSYQPTTDDTHGTITVNAKNIGNVSATSVPVKAYVYNDVGTYVEVASFTIPSVPAHGTAIGSGSAILPTTNLVPGSHLVKVMLNPNKTITESFYLNNNNGRGQDTRYNVTSTITVMNGTVPVVGALVNAFNDSTPPGYLGATYTNANGQAQFSTRQGVNIKYVVKAGVNGTLCQSNTTGYAPAPHNETIQLPTQTSSFNFYVAGNPAGLDYISATSPNASVCSNVKIGDPLYIQPGLSVRYGFFYGSSYYDTPFNTTPYRTKFCVDAAGIERACPSGGGGGGKILMPVDNPLSVN